MAHALVLLSIVIPALCAENLLSLDKQRSLEEFHEKNVAQFAKQKGLGFTRMPPDHRPGPFPKTFMLAPNESWIVLSLELVGIAKHTEPVAYLPHQSEMPAPPPRVRPLNDFEKTQVPILTRKKSVVAHGDHQEIKMVGAILAESRCLKCHQDAKSEVLGAFSYVLRRSK